MSKNTVCLVVENESEMEAINAFNVDEIKEKRILKLLETHSLLSGCGFSFIHPSKLLIILFL